MPKRRITKASKRRLTIFGTISLIAIIYFLISLVYSCYSIYNLMQEKERLENLYVELEQEAEDLKLDIEKLNDPNYLADYARENYLYSKEGEYIIQIGEEITETVETIDTINTTIDKNYILLSLMLLIIAIFIYIILKGRNKKTKK